MYRRTRGITDFCHTILIFLNWPLLMENEESDSLVGVNTEFERLDELSEFSSKLFCCRFRLVLNFRLLIKLSLSSPLRKSKSELAWSLLKAFLPVTQKNIPFPRFCRWAIESTCPF